MSKADKDISQHFGFEKVGEEKKAGMVHEVFSSVAGRYDLMNDVMSFGTHRLWKNRMVNMIPFKNGMKVLDMAGGTGDIAFRILKRAAKKGLGAEVIVSDINQNMLDEGKARAIDNNILQAISFKKADAEKLPFADNQLDIYTIAFGIRNVTHMEAALAEAFRVLKPGGKFLCMEFSKLDNNLLAGIYDAYSFNIIPKMGQMITGDSASYKYLVESIRLFPDVREFKGMIEKAGFSRCDFLRLSAGAVAIHTGWKV